MHIKKISGIIILSVIMAVFINPVYADTDLENEDLARIKQVLNSLTPLINEAEQEQNKSARIQFQYDWLRSDINQIKQGIDQKIKASPLEPRRVTPLYGDYIQKNEFEKNDS